MTAPTHTPRQQRINLGRIGQAGEVLALTAEGFSVADFNLAAHAVEKAGYRTTLASAAKALVAGLAESGEEMNFVVDKPLDEADTSEFRGLVLAGGARHIDALRSDERARAVIADFFSQNRPILALNEGVALLGEISGKEGVEGQGAVAIKGEVFTGAGETAEADAVTAFINAISVMADAA